MARRTVTWEEKIEKNNSILHAMKVKNYCNQLIGEQVNRLTADAIYVLLMGCLFHDVGMGVSWEDYECFKLKLDNPTSTQRLDEIIRGSHHILSAMYLEKYWELLDIPNEAYLFAIMQVCKGHRKTDLMNEGNYPSALRSEKFCYCSLPPLTFMKSDEIQILFMWITIFAQDNHVDGCLVCFFS